jgi:predicted transglutaminase-like cysteine proteinase
MQLKVTVTRGLEEDGVDQVLTLEQDDIGDYVQDSLRFFLEAMQAMGFTYLEALQATAGSGNSYSSEDL